MLLFDDEINQVLLLGELVPESQSVVEQSEAYADIAAVLGLVERDLQFVVVVPYFALFSPYGPPGLIEGGNARITYLEAGHEIGAAVNSLFLLHLGPFESYLFLRIFPLQFQSELAGLDYGLVFEEKFIGGSPLWVEAEVHYQISVRRCEPLRVCDEGTAA